MKYFTIYNIIEKYRDLLDQIDIELIIAHVIQKDRTYCLTHKNTPLTSLQHKKILSLCEKRRNGYPFAYISGKKEFFGKDFIVNSHTLIPRDETEDLVNAVINTVDKKKMKNVLLCDIGTGSGIIPIILGIELNSRKTRSTIIATDISKKALSVAQKNALIHKVKNINFLHEDLLSQSVQKKIIDSSHTDILITANLPYVDENLKETLFAKRESAALPYEPESALWSKDAGMAHYKKMIMQIYELTKDTKKKRNYYFFIEIDPEQKDDLCALINQELSPPFLAVHKDLAQRDRIIEWWQNT